MGLALVADPLALVGAVDPGLRRRPRLGGPGAVLRGASELQEPLVDPAYLALRRPLTLPPKGLHGAVLVLSPPPSVLESSSLVPRPPTTPVAPETPVKEDVEDVVLVPVRVTGPFYLLVLLG